MGEGVHTILVKDIAPPPGYERSVDAPPPIAGKFAVAMTEPAYGPRDGTHRTRLEESPKLSLGQAISSDRGLAGRLVSARIPSDYALTVRCVSQHMVRRLRSGGLRRGLKGAVKPAQVR